MTERILSLISHWLLPSRISVEKRLAALRDTNHDLERVMARRVYARLRMGRRGEHGSSGADPAL